MKMNVVFLHPRQSGTFAAEIGAETTGEKCLQGLIESNFLEPAPSDQPYEMQVSRTRQQLGKEMTVGNADVQEGDTIAVLQRSYGAAF